MNNEILLLAIGSFAIYLIGRKNMDTIYKAYEREFDVDWKIIKAIAILESGEDSKAINNSDPSYGLMQILCTKPEGYKGGNYSCQNKFNVHPWPVTRDDLFCPGVNVRIGTQILKWNLEKYGFAKGVAVYNNWSARHSPKNGPFPNQSYVNKFMEIYAGLKDE